MGATAVDPGMLGPKIYEHSHRLLKTHETLLRDSVRNRAFYEALKRHVTLDSIVLDIGAGTGVWAITAAKLGAKRAIAVEADEMLSGVIMQLAAELGVEHKVEVVCGRSFDIQPEYEADIVVSETIGYLGYDENIVEIMADARRRFLKRGGVMIPETIALYAAAAQLNVRKETVPVGIPLDLGTLQRLNLHSPRVLKRPRDARLLTRPKRLIQTDLRTSDATPSLKNLHAEWNVADANNTNCFIVWVESRLTRGVRLSTRRTTSWLPNVYRIEPVNGRYTHIEFDLSLTNESNYWTATFTDGDKRISQTYSPAIAAREMMAAKSDSDAGPVISLRPETDDDEEFLYKVYAATRRDEVASFGWDEASQEAFLKMQFLAQRSAYRMQSPAAQNSVIMADKSSAGRMVVDRSGDRISLTDIAVLPEFRGKGIATHLIKDLQGEAAEAAKLLVLHVDKLNVPAFRLYKKLGFAVTAETEFTIEMKLTKENA